MDARCGSFQITGTGTTTFDTGLGATPQALWFLVGPPDSVDTLHDDIDVGLGHCATDLTQYAVGFYVPWGDYTGARTDWASAETASSSIYVASYPFPTAPTVRVEGAVTAANSDGTVDINVTTLDATRTIGYLAMTGVDAKIGTVTWNGSLVTTNPWSPNRTPTLVSMIGRFNVASLAMCHAPELGVATFTDPVDHDDTFPAAASAAVMFWEHGSPFTSGAYADYYTDSVGSGGTSQCNYIFGGIARMGTNVQDYDVFTPKVVTDGFTFDRTFTVVPWNNQTFHYMAVDVDDSAIYSEHATSNDIHGYQTVTDLRADALLCCGSLGNGFPGIDPLYAASWGFADTHGNQVAMYASARSAGTGDNNIIASSGIFDDRVLEIAVGTIGATAPNTKFSTTVDNSDPTSYTLNTPQATTFHDVFPSVVVVGPLKTAVPQTDLPQIIRYR